MKSIVQATDLENVELVSATPTRHMRKVAQVSTDFSGTAPI
jgi:hypothetical protein